MREYLVGQGFTDDVAWMDEHLDELGGPHSYGIYPVGWALAMNTPYQWTKQVASHYGGTRKRTRRSPAAWTCTVTGRR